MDINLILSFEKALPSKINFSKPVIEFNNFQLSLVEKENFLDFYDLNLHNNSSLPIFTPSNKLISEDGLHLTKEGADFFGKKLLALLLKKLNSVQCGKSLI